MSARCEHCGQPLPDTFAGRLLSVRLYRGWSLSELADKSGISKSLIHKYENGTAPGLGNLALLAQALGTSLDYLVLGVGPMVEYPNACEGDADAPAHTRNTEGR